MKYTCVMIYAICSLIAGCTVQQPPERAPSAESAPTEVTLRQEPVEVKSLQKDVAATLKKIEDFLGVRTSLEGYAATQLSESPGPARFAQTAKIPEVEALPRSNPVTFQAQALPPASQDARFQQSGPGEAKGIGLNFDNADIYDVTRVVSEITGKSFIIDKDVSGTVTIFSESSLTPAQVFDLFKTVLELNQLAIKQVGNYYKIVPTKPKSYLEADSGTLLNSGDQVVTRIVKLKHVRAEDVGSALQSLMPEGKEIVVYPDAANGDTLIITDIASNVGKILDVIRDIDVSRYANQQFEIFPIQYADLQDLIHDLNQILSLQQVVVSPTGQEMPQMTEMGQPNETETPELLDAIVPPGTKTKLYPITRLNALFVSTNNAEVIALVKKWIDILDRPPIREMETVSPNESINHVYPVQYARAEELTPLLAQVYDKSFREQLQQEEQPPQEQQDEQQEEQPEVPQPQVTQQQGGEAPVFIPEPKTNSIVIKSTENEYAEIKQLLAKLDQRPLQVLIDVIIAEVSLDDSEILGLRGTLLSQDQVTIGGETNSVSTTAQTVFDNVMPEGAEGFTYVVTAPGRFLAQLRALATKNKVKVLSDPHVLVRNNEEATMNVGSRIPIKETTGTGDDVKESISYQEVGIILTVTPQINLDGDVVMQIKQTISDVGQEQFGDTGAASFTNREAVTTVITQDGYPIVLGGLIQNRDEQIQTGVPLLKDIPLLGRLFRHSEDKKRRQDLFILVTPRVIRTPGQGWAVTDNVLQQRVNDLEQLFNREHTDSDRIKKFIKDPFH